MKQLLFVSIVFIASVSYGMIPAHLSALSSRAIEKNRYYKELLKLVKYRIENHQSLDEPIEGNTLTPLENAVIHGDSYLAITQLILDNNAHPDGDEKQDITPLQRASCNLYHSIEIIKLLIAKNADPYKSLPNEKTSFNIICHADNDAIVEEPAKKRVEIISSMLKKRTGLNVNHDLEQLICNMGFFMLYHPSEKDLVLKQRKHLIQLIIDHGGNPFTANKEGKKPIELAHKIEIETDIKQYFIELAEFAQKYYARKTFLTLLSELKDDLQTNPATTSFLYYLPSELIIEIANFLCLPIK